MTELVEFTVFVDDFLVLSQVFLPDCVLDYRQFGDTHNRVMASSFVRE